MYCSTAADDAHVERKVSPAGGDDVDQGDDPHDIPQPESEDITQTDSEDVAQPEALAFLELKEHEVWTIGMCRLITNVGGRGDRGGPWFAPKNNEKKNLLKRKKQSLVLISVIWPPPKKIRALF